VLVGVIPLLMSGTNSQPADTVVSTSAVATTTTTIEESESAATAPTSTVPLTTTLNVPIPSATAEEIAKQGIVQSARQPLEPLPTGGTSVYWLAQTHDFEDSHISRLHITRADTSTGRVVKGVLGDVQVGWSRAGPDVVDMAASRDTLWVAWTEAIDRDGDGDLESGDTILLAVDDETLEVDQMFRLSGEEREARFNKDGIRVEVSGHNVWLASGDSLWVIPTDALGTPVEVDVPTMRPGLQPFGGGPSFDLWAVTGGGVVIGSGDTGYQMFSADGEPRWTRRDLAFALSPISPASAYTMTEDGKLTVIEPVTGSVQRTLDTGIDDVDAILCCFDNAIHVRSSDGNGDDQRWVFSLVDPTTGAVVSDHWVIDLGNLARSAVEIDRILFLAPGIIYDPVTITATANPFGVDPDIHPSFATVRPAN